MKVEATERLTKTLWHLFHRARCADFEAALEPNPLWIKIHHPVDLVVDSDQVPTVIGSRIKDAGMTLNHLRVTREISSGLMGGETEGPTMVDRQLGEVINGQTAKG